MTTDNVITTLWGRMIEDWVDCRLDAHDPTAPPTPGKPRLSRLVCSDFATPLEFVPHNRVQVPKGTTFIKPVEGELLLIRGCNSYLVWVADWSTDPSSPTPQKFIMDFDCMEAVRLCTLGVSLRAKGHHKHSRSDIDSHYRLLAATFSVGRNVWDVLVPHNLTMAIQSFPRTYLACRALLDAHSLQIWMPVTIPEPRPC